MINRDSTAEAMWAHVLTAWQEKGLPTPSCIDALDHTVWLPNNERGQVDVWAAALGLTAPSTGDGWRRADGTPSTSVSYRAYAPDIFASNLAVICTLELGDAELHWSPPGVAESSLSAAARAVAATLARPTQDDHLADYGPNLGPSDAPCLTVVGTGPTCGNCGGPASGVHSNHTRTEDAAYAAADLPPYVTVEVLRQAPERSITCVRVYGDRFWVPYGVGGNAPSWLAEVPVGKAPLVRADFDGPAMAWTFTDWVEPAADGCSPRPTDDGRWDISDDNETCPRQNYSWGHATPAAAVAAHNAWLSSALHRPTEDQPEPAAPVAVSPERVEDFDSLRKHLVTSHVMLSALGFSDKELVRAHEDEHDGPCTIRNHDRADRSFDDAKIAKIRADEGYPCYGCGWTNQECIDEMNSNPSQPRCCGMCGINDSHGVIGVQS